MSDKVNKTEEEWKEELAPEEYRVLREKGTETAFTGEFCNHKEKGTYTCAGCGQPLFVSEAKYESGSGWPSFYQPVGKQSISEEADNSILMNRTEILCSRCGGHLGHVFDDGPTTLPDGRQATGLRYCVNSASLDFRKKK